MVQFQDRVYSAREQQYGVAGMIGIVFVVILLLSIIIWLATRSTGSSDAESVSSPATETPAPGTPASGTPTDPAAPAPGPVAPKPTETSKRYACPAKTTSVCEWTTEKEGSNRCEANFTEKGCFRTTAQEDCAKWGTWIDLDDTKNPYTCAASSGQQGGGPLEGPLGGPSNSGSCSWTRKDWKTQTAQYSNTCTEEKAKQECETQQKGNWIPLDYSSNPYTCQSKLGPLGTSCRYSNDCDSGICNNGSCVDQRCGPAYSNQKCVANRCCSVGAFCGTTSDHCTNRSNSNFNGSGA